MNVWKGAYVVMPDHFHAIIGIGDNRYNTRQDPKHDPPPRDAMHCVSDNITKNLASIIRGFKIGVTKNARQINPNFQWQARYHDHIILDEKSYRNISKYIENNPIKWEINKFR